MKNGNGEPHFNNFNKPQRDEDIHKEINTQVEQRTLPEQERKKSVSIENKKTFEISDVIVERNHNGSIQGTLYIKTPGSDLGFSLLWSVHDLLGHGTEFELHPEMNDEKGMMIKFIDFYKKEIIDTLIEHLPIYPAS